jgi:hypothetical protein
MLTAFALETKVCLRFVLRQADAILEVAFRIGATTLDLDK